jgi:hypothetical protein
MNSRNGRALLRRFTDAKGGVAVVLLLLIAIALGVVAAMAYLRVKKQETELADLNAQLQKVRAVAAAPAAKPSAETEKDALVRKDVEKKAGELSAKLSEAEKARGALEQRIAALSKEKDDLAALLNDNAAKMKDLLDTNKKLEKKMADAQAALDDAKGALAAKDAELADALAKLDKAEGALEELKVTLAKAQKEADTTARKLVEEIEARDLKIEELKAALQEFPTAPLPEDVAKAKYDKIIEQVNAAAERADKIALLFKGAMILNGTSYETKLELQLGTEQKALQADREKLATELNKQANDKIKANPDAYDENIAFLADALEKAKGTKMEKSIQKLLDDQTKKKADAARKAAPPAQPAPPAPEGAAQ